MCWSGVAVCERPPHLWKPGVLGQLACLLTLAASRGRKQGRGSAAWGLSHSPNHLLPSFSKALS